MGERNLRLRKRTVAGFGRWEVRRGGSYLAKALIPADKV
jgi:hypothetical protein